MRMDLACPTMRSRSAAATPSNTDSPAISDRSRLANCLSSPTSMVLRSQAPGQTLSWTTVHRQVRPAVVLSLATAIHFLFALRQIPPLGAGIEESKRAHRLVSNEACHGNSTD